MVSGRIGSGDHMPDNETVQIDNEEILLPELPVCDPHHHFFDFPDFKYMPGDFLEDISTGHHIVRTVYVECRTGYRDDGPEELRSVGETEYIETLISRRIPSGLMGVVSGIVGFADLRLGDAVKPVLEAHRTASPKKFCGIRNVAAWNNHPAFSKGYNAPQAGLLMDSAFRKGFAHLEKLTLGFDAMLFHTQLPELIDLAMSFPDTKIILDHSGVPLGIGPYAQRLDEVFRTWKNGMKKLSKCKNVFVKIGGFGMKICAYGLSGITKPIGSVDLAETIRPYCLWCIEQFGVHRCMFESNFPVDKELVSYRVLWNAYKRISADFSSGERQALFHDTAMQAYGL